MLHLVHILLGEVKHVDVVACCYFLPPAAVHTCQGLGLSVGRNDFFLTIFQKKEHEGAMQHKI